MTRLFLRLLRFPIGAAALVASLAVGARPASPAAPAQATAPSTANDPTVPAFRLGTAARPFAWATAVADFNRDGVADTAVADRQSRAGAGYLYQLRFSVSGLASPIGVVRIHPACHRHGRDVATA